MKRNGSSGGAFHPFKKEKSTAAIAVGTTTTTAIAPPQGPVNKSASTSSTAETGGGGGGNKNEAEKESQRKSRRCWSPELHRRFLQALQQLGGSHRMLQNHTLIFLIMNVTFIRFSFSDCSY